MTFASAHNLRPSVLVLTAMCVGMFLTCLFIPESVMAQIPGADPTALPASAGGGTQGSGSSAPDSCTFSIFSPGDSISCLIHYFISTIGTVPALFGVFIAGLAGYVFDQIIVMTIPNINQTILSASLQNSVNLVWTAFRDLANIFIIAIFTFIAISMILGVESFGSRKLVARVLIIAILINFSLLFSSIIIRGTNYVAIQFYNAAVAAGLPAGQVAGAGNQNGQNTSIAGAYMQAMGLPSIMNTADAISGTFNSVSGATKSGYFFGIIYGIFMLIILSAAAAIFLYGAIMLVSRVILLIFLMSVSPLAFAAYLTEHTKSFWSQWWTMLIRSSLIAPLLMLMLWATLQIATSFNFGGGSLGGVVSNPANTDNVAAIFRYLVVLGLLYASFKVSSSFAARISGLASINGLSGSLAGAVAGLPFAMGGRFAGAVGRRTIGKPSDLLARRLENAAASGAYSLRATRALQAGARSFENLARKEFNPLGNKVLQTAQKGLGVSLPRALGSTTPENEKGVRGRIERDTRMALQQGEKATANMSPEQMKEFRDTVVASTIAGNKELSERHSQAKDGAEALETQIKHLTEENERASSDMQKNIANMEENMKKLQSQPDNNIEAFTEKKRKTEALQADIEHAKSQERERLNASKSKIEEIQQEIDRRQAIIKEVETRAQNIAIQSGKLTPSIAKAEQILNQNRGTVNRLALGAIGIKAAPSEVVADALRKEAEKQGESKRMKKLLDFIQQNKQHVPAVSNSQAGSMPRTATPIQDKRASSVD